LSSDERLNPCNAGGQLLLSAGGKIFLLYQLSVFQLSAGLHNCEKGWLILPVALN
jgi:hypothetical protein